MKSPFALEQYLSALQDRTAWAPDCPIEDYPGPRVPRPVLYRIANLWARALLDDRFETLLLPVLITEPPAARSGHGLPQEFFEERLRSRACLLLIDGPEEEADRWPGNRVFYAVEQWDNERHA